MYSAERVIMLLVLAGGGLAIGWVVGQTCPAGLAAMAEPGSTLRNEASQLYAIIGMVAGIGLTILCSIANKRE